MPIRQLIPVSEGFIEYCFEQRLFKDKYSIDEEYFKKLWLDNKQYIRVIIIDDLIIGITGFIPCEDGLLGYLVLTNNYPIYARYVVRQMREVLKKFKCKVKFLNHVDDKLIQKWYDLIGFKREGDYWVREAII